jgi:hypothetical protein
MPQRRPSQGLPTKFTTRNKDSIIQALKLGAHMDTAARYGGVSYQTFRKWLTRGELLSEDDYDELEPDEKEFVDFYYRVVDAEAQAEMAALTKWRSFMDKDYKAARDFMARRWPARWGSKVEITISTKDDEILELLDELEKDELEMDDDPQPVESYDVIDVDSIEIPSVKEIEPKKDEDGRSD